MTKLEALRAVLASPRNEPDLARIGHRVIYDKPDGREVIHRFNRWQMQADRILRRRSA